MLVVFPFVLQFFHLFCWLCFKADLLPSDAALRLSFYAQRVRLGASAEAADTTHTTVTTVDGRAPESARVFGHDLLNA